MSDYLMPRGHASFQDVFPDINDIRIKVIVKRGGGQEVGSKTYTKESFPVNGVKCENPSCKNGGLSDTKIPLLIKQMVTKKQTDLEDQAFCKGGLYRGQNRYNECSWSFDIKLSIQYKER